MDIEAIKRKVGFEYAEVRAIQDGDKTTLAKLALTSLETGIKTLEATLPEGAEEALKALVKGSLLLTVVVESLTKVTDSWIERKRQIKLPESLISMLDKHRHIKDMVELCSLLIDNELSNRRPLTGIEVARHFNVRDRTTTRWKKILEKLGFIAKGRGPYGPLTGKLLEIVNEERHRK